jgi:hypothetical protein
MQSRLTNKIVQKQDSLPLAGYYNRNDIGLCSACYIQVEVLTHRNTNMLSCHRLATLTVKYYMQVEVLPATAEKH